MDTLAVDIGNSRIKAGYFRGRKLTDFIHFPSDMPEGFFLPSSWSGRKPDVIGISSVVPGIESQVVEKTSVFFPGSSIFLIRASDCGINLRIRNPLSVGVDRVLNCRAAREIYGKGALVADIGTAVTLDIISARGDFEGGFIIPGPGLWESALDRTAMINLPGRSAARIPGRDTAGAIAAGVRYGMAGALNGIIGAVLGKYPSLEIDSRFFRPCFIYLPVHSSSFIGLDAGVENLSPCRFHFEL